MRHRFCAREAGAVVVSRWRRGFLFGRGSYDGRFCYGNTGGGHCGHCGNEDAVTELNALLHQYGAYIIGRMGVPYRARGVNIISVVLDAPQDAISALSGKIGRLEGVSAKTLYSNVITPIEDR